MNEYPTYYETIVRNVFWKEWVKENEKNLHFDVHESNAYEIQASYTQFSFPVGGYKTKNELPKALHQFVPFPDNLIHAITNLSIFNL